MSDRLVVKISKWSHLILWPVEIIRSAMADVWQLFMSALSFDYMIEKPELFKARRVETVTWTFGSHNRGKFVCQPASSKYFLPVCFILELRGIRKNSLNDWPHGEQWVLIHNGVSVKRNSLFPLGQPLTVYYPRQDHVVLGTRRGAKFPQKNELLRYRNETSCKPTFEPLNWEVKFFDSARADRDRLINLSPGARCVQLHVKNLLYREKSRISFG